MFGNFLYVWLLEPEPEPEPEPVKRGPVLGLVWLGIRQEIMFDFNCCIFTELQIVVIKKIITKLSEPDPHFQSAQHSKVSFVQPLGLKQELQIVVKKKNY